MCTIIINNNKNNKFYILLKFKRYINLDIIKEKLYDFLLS